MLGICRGTPNTRQWYGPGHVRPAHILFSDGWESDYEFRNCPFSALVRFLSWQWNPSGERQHDHFGYVHECDEPQQSQYWKPNRQCFWIFRQQPDASRTELQCPGGRMHSRLLLRHEDESVALAETSKIPVRYEVSQELKVIAWNHTPIIKKPRETGPFYPITPATARGRRRTLPTRRAGPSFRAWTWYRDS